MNSENRSVRAEEPMLFIVGAKDCLVKRQVIWKTKSF